jgi:ATP-dependent Clp protease ATP-binding subunit ClpC
MAFENFTDRARKVVDFASAEAAQMGSDSVDTVHLLLGMIREGEGVAGKVLASQNVEADGVAESYKSFLTAPDVTLPEVESRSLFEAKWLKHNYVGTEHLILAVCSFSGCRAASVLADIGTPPHEVCRDVLHLLGHEQNYEQWLAEQPEDDRT